MEFTKKQIKFFEKAAEIAKQSEFDRYHIGCIAILKNKIIASSFNKLKTHSVQAKYDKYRNFNCLSDPKNMHALHAEIGCVQSIKLIDVDYKDIQLYIVRVLKNGEYGLSRPCAACMPYIKSKGIKHIYYTTNYGFAHEEIL